MGLLILTLNKEMSIQTEHHIDLLRTEILHHKELFVTKEQFTNEIGDLKEVIARDFVRLH